MVNLVHFCMTYIFNLFHMLNKSDKMTTIMRVQNMDFALLIMMLVPNMTSGKIAFTS